MIGEMGGLRIGVSACVGVILLVIPLFLTPPTTEAVPAPHFRRRGRWAAAGLGFVGGYVVGRHRGWHHGGCGGCGGGCGGCYGGGGCGWCGGGHYGRKRRSIDELMEREHLEEVYRKVAEEDRDQCGRRLVCELAQKDPNHLTGDETLLLLPYRGRDESDEGTYYGQYDKAVWHGQRGNPCHDLYPFCNYPAQVIMSFVSPNDTMIEE